MGSVFLYGLEFHWEGAILALLLLLYSLKLDFQLDRWQPVASLVGRDSGGRSGVQRPSSLQRQGSEMQESSLSFTFACLPSFCWHRTHIPTCRIVQEAEANLDPSAP